MRERCRGGTKTISAYYTLLRCPYNTLSTNAPIKQASLRNSTCSLIERGVVPLGNLNKGYLAHFAWLTLNACVNARACTGLPLTSVFLPNLVHNHELHQGVAQPGLTYLTHRWRVQQGEGKTRHKRETTPCICVYV